MVPKVYVWDPMSEPRMIHSSVKEPTKEYIKGLGGPKTVPKVPADKAKDKILTT